VGREMFITLTFGLRLKKFGNHCTMTLYLHFQTNLFAGLMTQDVVLQLEAIYCGI